MSAIEDQPPPNPNSKPAIWPLVIKDIERVGCGGISTRVRPLLIADMGARHELGIERYGTPLQPFNGRDALIDAYQEALDLCAYMKQAAEERPNEATPQILYARALCLAHDIRAMFQ